MNPFTLSFKSQSLPTVVLLLLVLPCTVRAQEGEREWSGIPMTRWMSPNGEQPGTYAEYLARLGPPRPFSAARVPGLSRTGGATSGRVLLVLVNLAYNIYLKDEITVYVDDIAKEGFIPEVVTAIGGMPQDIRHLLKTQYYEVYGSAFAGVLLVGDLPVPWYDLSGDHFPSDLYYMDLDGDFFDDNADGLFDRHEDGQGDTAPDIFLGRLVATTFNGNAYETLEHYFDKVHAYRNGSFSVPGRALGFCDDDWSHWGLYGLDLGYTDVTIIDDHDLTSSANYEGKLDEGYHWIHTMAHSYSGGHHFATSTGGGWTFNHEVNAIDPWALFYQLFACSNCRYTDANYMGGAYIFCNTHGLGAVGSTKSGSMLSFEYFYDPMHRNASIGDAYLAWWEAMYPYGPGDQSWFYGMTLLGDPTLVVRPGYYNEKPVGPPGFAQYPPLHAEPPESGADFGKALGFGDIDHDGNNDLIIGEPGATVAGHSAAGKVVVIFGPDFSSRMEIAAEFPAPGEGFGTCLDVADLDQDGFDDIAVGAPGRDVQGMIDVGAVRILHGPSLTYGKTFTPAALKTQTRYGTALVAADFIKDGDPELAIGGPGGGDGGMIDVYQGPALVPYVHYDLTDYNFMSEFGGTLAAGDLNGDQIPDLLVAAPEAFSNHRGGFIAFMGPSLMWPIQPKGLNPAMLDRTGTSLISADFDQDGSDDVAVGAPGADTGGFHAAGQVHLFKGPILQYWKSLTAPAPERFAEFGTSLCAADFDGDGAIDLCTGAPYADDGDTADAGLVYLFSGPDLTDCRILHDPQPERGGGFGMVLEAGALIHGMLCLACGTPIATLDPSGNPVARAGDVNVIGFMLESDTTSIPGSAGGSATFSLNAGPPRAGRTYITAVSLSGTDPGTPLGGVTLPLNFDLLTNMGFIYLNSWFFKDFGGVLDPEGRGVSVFNLPAGLTGFTGLRFYFAFFTLDPVDFASNPVMVLISV